jgi:acetate kinase
VRVLVVNAGSASLKVDLVEDGRAVRSFDGLPDPPPEVDAVGHRVAHGGADLTGPVVVDAAVERRLRGLVELAPQAQLRSLAGLSAARELLPYVPHVACFDTDFCAGLPPAAAAGEQGARRYGSHGLSHAWAARRARELAPGCRRVVTCHLGAGMSLTAVLDGRAVDTTAPAGTTDVAAVLARADDGARLALDVYLHRLACGVAAMTVAPGGLDALVFTGGVGEHAAAVRSGAAARLAHLGVAVDEARDAAVTSADPDAEVSGDGARVRTLVVRSREDLAIAAGVEQALSEPET